MSQRGLRVAVEVARDAGLPVGRPVVLRDGSNLLVHLRPAPVVARVATATGLMRAGPRWLAREVAVAGHLARAGAPVVAPSAEIVPGPHVRNGLALTFWEYAEESAAPADAAEAGRRLRRCHEALAAFEGDLPRLGVLDEVEGIVERLAGTGTVSPDDATVLRRVAAAVREGVERLALPLQAVHGDAHLGNVLATSRGPLWNDWEDTFLGPLAWDLACLGAAARPFGRHDPARIAAARAGYGDRHDAPAVETCVDARRLQISVWGLAFAVSRSDDVEVRRHLRWVRERHRRGRADPVPARRAGR